MRTRLAPLIGSGLLVASLVGCGTLAPQKAKPASATPHAGTEAAAQPPSPSAAYKMQMILDFIPTGYQAPFYLGIQRGLYRKNGIDLTIALGHGSAAAIQELGSGKFPVGFADLTTAAIGTSHGLPIEAVAAFLQRNPFAVVYRADEGLTKPADLAGKSVGLNPEGAAKKLFQAMLGTNGVPMDSVKLVSMSGHALIASLAQKKVDAIVLTNLTALPQLSAIGVKAKAMLVSDWGVSALSEGLVVNTNFLAAHGDLVRSFVAASQQAWALAEKDPQAAVAAQAKALGPSLAPKGALGTLKLSFALLHTQASAGHPIGWMAPDDWTQTLKLLTKYYGVQKLLAPGRYYTDRFIAPAN